MSNTKLIWLLSIFTYPILTVSCTAGTSTMQPVPLETEAEVVHSNEENMPDADNEEG